MSDWTNIARPYAKAVFMHALQHQSLSQWSGWLSQLEQMMSSAELLLFIQNPETSAAQHQSVIRDVMSACPGMPSPFPDTLDAFITVLAQNRRLPVLPAIVAQFEALRADEENRISVSVESFLPLTDEEEARLVERLTERLKRKVTLNISINSELLGGAVISAKDWVINASVKGQLNKLGADLIASSRG